MLPVVVNSFSAFLHVLSSSSSEIVVIPDLSGGMERRFLFIYLFIFYFFIFFIYIYINGSNSQGLV